MSDLIWQLYCIKGQLLVGTDSPSPPAATATLEQFLTDLEFSSIDEREKSGFTPLRYAVYAGRADLVRQLIDKGAKVNTLTRKPLPQFNVHPGQPIIQSACSRADIQRRRNS